jgi:hypothetical protein
MMHGSTNIKLSKLQNISFKGEGGKEKKRRKKKDGDKIK